MQSAKCSASFTSFVGWHGSRFTYIRGTIGVLRRSTPIKMLFVCFVVVVAFLFLLLWLCGDYGRSKCEEKGTQPKTTLNPRYCYFRRRTEPKGGGLGGLDARSDGQRTPRLGAESERFGLKKMKPSYKTESKEPSIEFVYCGYH